MFQDSACRNSFCRVSQSVMYRVVSEHVWTEANVSLYRVQKVVWTKGCCLRCTVDLAGIVQEPRVCSRDRVVVVFHTSSPSRVRSIEQPAFADSGYRPPSLKDNPRYLLAAADKVRQIQITFEMDGDDDDLHGPSAPDPGRESVQSPRT